MQCMIAWLKGKISMATTPSIINKYAFAHLRFDSIITGFYTMFMQVISLMTDKKVIREQWKGQQV